MEGLIVLILLGLVAVVFVLPIVALVSAANAKREAAQARSDYEDLNSEIMRLRRELKDLAARPGAAAAASVPPVEQPAAPIPPAVPEVPPVLTTPAAEAADFVEASPEPTPEAPPLFASTPAPDLAPPPLPESRPESAVFLPPVPPPITRPAAQEATVAPEVKAEPAPAFNLEQFVGVKLFAWLGAAGIFAFVGYVLKLSFDYGWFPPPVRAAGGFVLAVGLLLGGLFSIRRQFAVAGQSLCAAGVLVLYAVTFACRAYYRFPAFAGEHVTLPFSLMILTTAVAFLLAVRLRAQVVAILGLAGGFATPIMLSTGTDQPFGLFSYIALLDIGLLAVALHRRWQHLAILAAAGTAFMQVGWAIEFFSAEKLTIAVLICTTFLALFTIAVAAARKLDRTSDWMGGAALIPIVVAAGFALTFTALPSAAQQPVHVLGLVLLADLALLTVVTLQPSFAQLHPAGGLAGMIISAIWITRAATTGLLPWALGFVFVFAALHTVFPFVLRRFNPQAREVSWSGLFAPIGLLVTLLPVIRLNDVGALFWPLVLLLDLVAIAAAAATGLLSALAGAVVLTLVVLGAAILRMPATSMNGGLELLLVAAFAVLFVAASVWLIRRIATRETDADSEAEPSWLLHLPAASATMPFVLLVMLAVKLPMLNPSPVFGVALLLVALLLGLGTVARMGPLMLAALIGALVVEYAWAAEHLTPDNVRIGLLWFVGFSFVFTAYPFAQLERLLPLQAPWAAAALALPMHFALMARGVQLGWPLAFDEAAGALAAVCALPPLAGLVLLLRMIPMDAPWRLNRIAWFGGAALFFITLIFPLQLSNQWLTLGWALEGVALLWLFHRVPHPGLRAVGVALLVATFVRLVLNPEILAYAARGDRPIFNWILGVYGVATICCFAGARLLAPPRDQVFGIPAPALLATLGTILAFALINLEIADFFTPAGSQIHFEFSGNFARDMSYTIAWALFAFVLMIVGIVRRLRAPRYAGIALLMVTFGKLLLHDLARLHTFYRISAIMVVAIVMLAAAFAYQRFFGRAARPEAPSPHPQDTPQG